MELACFPQSDYMACSCGSFTVSHDNRIVCGFGICSTERSRPIIYVCISTKPFPCIQTRSPHQYNLRKRSGALTSPIKHCCTLWHRDGSSQGAMSTTEDLHPLNGNQTFSFIRGSSLLLR